MNSNSNIKSKVKGNNFPVVTLCVIYFTDSEQLTWNHRLSWYFVAKHTCILLPMILDPIVMIIYTTVNTYFHLFMKNQRKWSQIRLRHLSALTCKLEKVSTGLQYYFPLVFFPCLRFFPTRRFFSAFCFFSSLCFFLWVNSDEGWLYPAPHTSHLYLLSSVCVLRCDLNMHLFFNHLPHSLHWTDWEPSWLFMCSLR